MITLNGKQYPNTKEFSEITGIPVPTLKMLINRYPDATIKWHSQRLWDQEAFAKEFYKGRGVQNDDHPGPKRRLEPA